MTNRASSTLAFSPKTYDNKHGFWKDTNELDRFAPKYMEAEDVFEEYMGNQSLSPSRHQLALKKSSGLMELHYDTMRKKAMERARHPVQKAIPTMDRAYSACSGYSGLIPGKVSNNIVGCSFMDGSKLAQETRGKFFDAPMSGVTYTLGFKSPMARSSSMPSMMHGSNSPGSTLSQAGGMAVSPGKPRLMSEDSMFS
eukprot:TRINITY_DN40750_c0_g1_i1.p1 TRINITY_DN40750_c0_g1~~TRINITY_DN40750_c0_g1_i1.p1  ORF type:complete len:197 (+),score=44.86 TRINITY_DN40750_c0_g1_i1:99-689(+)